MFSIVSGLSWISFYFTGTTNCVQFLQTPNILAKHKGTEEIFCSHDDSTLTVMLWYRQASGSTVMALIGQGYTTGEPTYETEFKGGRFELRREGVIKGSLVISNLTLLDSALYFCAASDTVLQMSTAPSLKTLIKGV